MPEGSRWMPMSERTSSRMFGIYREPDPGRRDSLRINLKLILLLVVLAASTLLVIVVALKLSSDVNSFTSNNAERRLDTEEVTVFGPSIKTLPSWLNATDAVQDKVQDTLGRPLGAEVLTETYSVGSGAQGERAIIQEATTVSQQQERRARAYIEEVRKARIVNRPRFPDQDLASAYSQAPIFTDQYAQLEGYRSPIRGLQDVMTWVEKPGIKFSGVYYKAEESKPFLNGHAYVADPFVKFKPSHPAEINQLAVEPERGTRFSNRPSSDTQSVASHTQAVFHPYPPLRPKPLKIMLDIYPMVPEPPLGSFPPDIVADPRGRRQRMSSTANSKRMLVQLNLYPRRNQRKSFRRPTIIDEGVTRQFDDAMKPREEETNQMTTVTPIEETTLP